MEPPEQRTIASPTIVESYTPWNPPAGATVFGLKRRSGEHWEDCTLWWAGTKVTAHPTSPEPGQRFTKEAILGIWGGGDYRATFRGPDADGKLTLRGGPIRFSVEHPQGWIGPNEARPQRAAEPAPAPPAVEEEESELARLRRENAELRAGARSPYAPPPPPPRRAPDPPPAPRKDLATMTPWEMMVFFREDSERWAERRLEREQEDNRRRQAEDEARHQRSLTEAEGRHKRSLEFVTTLAKANAQAAADAALALDPDDEDEEDEEEAPDPMKEAIVGGVKQVAAIGLPALAGFLRTKFGGPT